MNNFTDEENIAYDPIVFNLMSRVNMVEKRGGSAHVVEAFELNRYLQLSVDKILASEEYGKYISDPLGTKEMYPEYLIALLCPQRIGASPV